MNDSIFLVNVVAVYYIVAYRNKEPERRKTITIIIITMIITKAKKVTEQNSFKILRLSRTTNFYFLAEGNSLLIKSQKLCDYQVLEKLGSF